MDIDLIRICGALLIFLCHACGESGNSIGGMLGQAFNVGVPLFFILSGYLHGLKDAPKYVLKWYGKKLQRLMIPLYCFLALLAVLWCINGYQLDPIEWLQTIIPVCGLTQNYISGCGQMWFLTHLLICYAITPLLQKSRRELFKPWILIPTWGAVAVVLAYTVPQIWGTLWNSVLNYCVGFYLIPKLIKKRCHCIVPVCSAAAACALRLVFHAVLDGTPFYDTVATEVCSLTLAGSIFVFLYQFGSSLKKIENPLVCKTVSAISKRTYEFYLTHYIF